MKNSSFVSIRLRRSPLRAGFAIIVPAKIYKRAVDRNKLKRRIRAIVRDLKLKNSRPIIIQMKKGALELSFKELEQEIKKVLI
jgi:ribonuclease P protein component